MRALQKEGIEQVRFYDTDGALGYRPDDSYFAEKIIMLARLKNWAMVKLSTLDVASAVKQANEIGFDHVEMIQDDKKRWALYILSLIHISVPDKSMLSTLLSLMQAGTSPPVCHKPAD